MNRKTAIGSAVGLLQLGGFSITETELEGLLSSRSEFERHYSPAEVAEKLSLCKYTIYEKIKNGVLKAVNLGTARKPKYVVAESEIVGFLNRNSATTAIATEHGNHGND